MTIPAISAVARAPSPASSGTPSRTASSAVISHVAAAAGVDPVARPPGVVGGVVVDDHPRQVAEQLRVAAGDRADALGRRAVGQDQQVVGDGGIRIRADALDVGHERVDRRRLVGEHRGRAPADGLDQAAQRERRAERVRVRVLVADGEHLARASQASHHLVGDRCGGERDEVDGLGHPRREPGLPDRGLAAGLAVAGPARAGRAAARLGPTALRRPVPGAGRRRATPLRRPLRRVRDRRRRRRPDRRCRPRGAGGGPASAASP